MTKGCVERGERERKEGGAVGWVETRDQKVGVFLWERAALLRMITDNELLRHGNTTTRH